MYEVVIPSFVPVEEVVATPIMKRIRKTAEMNDERIKAVARIQTSWDNRVRDFCSCANSASKGVT